MTLYVVQRQNDWGFSHFVFVVFVCSFVCLLVSCFFCLFVCLLVWCFLFLVSSTLYFSSIIITLLVFIVISAFLVSYAGWGLSHMEVWRGFLVTIGWFLLFLIVAGFALRLRK